MSDPKLMTVREVADVLRVSRQHVYELCKKGKLKSIPVGEKAIRITEAELNRFLRTKSVVHA